MKIELLALLLFNKNVFFNMAIQGKIRRFTLIIEIINRVPNLNFEDIKQYLYSNGFEVSKRTIERDIEHIRYEFGIYIKYNRQINGYYIDHENSLNIDSFFNFLEMANISELLQESMHENKSSLNSIVFDSSSNLKGIENLGPFLRAIKEKKKASFKHVNFKTNQEKQFIIKPYLLKEYQKRWYIIGLTEDEKMTTFGIDRVEDLKILDEKFKFDKKINPANLFKNTIGIIYSSHPVQEVILSFTPLQGKYVKTLPFHHSQKVLIDNETEFRISIKVSPNYELNQLILKHGDTVKVIEPEWLIEEIKDKLDRTRAKYCYVKLRNK